MIISYIQGGLGNQMFQYAAGAALAARLNTHLLLDTTAYSNEQFHHGFELAIFPNLELQKATQKDIKKFSKSGSLFERWKTTVFQTSFFSEPHFHYTDAFSKINNLNTYIKGYWQSEKYFLHIADRIRIFFDFPKPSDTQNQHFFQQCQSSESVSIHVRRGDYVSNPAANAVHGTCNADYYQRSLSAVKERYPNAKFFVFSDDIPWVKSQIDLPETTVFVDFNSGKNSWMDMRLMSSCKHNIIANSTFSWWGAWLNKNPGKLIVAPKQWFASDSFDCKDLIPDSWQRI